MWNRKGIILEKLQTVLELDEKEQLLVSSVLDSAIKAICSKRSEKGPNDFNPDDVQKLNEKKDAVLIKCERMLQFFKDGITIRDDFLRTFREYENCIDETFTFLRKKVVDLGILPQKIEERDGDRSVSHSVLTTLGALFSAFPFSTVFEHERRRPVYHEIDTLRGELREADAKIRKEKDKYSEIRRFSHSEELENAISSLVRVQVFLQIVQKVDAFNREVRNKKKMTENEFKNHFERVLDDCMGFMAEDGEMVKENGKELAPVVMTFVFVVCLLNDHNTNFPNSILETSLSLNLSGGMFNLGAVAGAMIGFTPIFDGFPDCFLTMFDEIVYILNGGQECTEFLLRIKEPIDKIQEIFWYIQEVHNQTKKYKSVAEVEWKNLLINETPDEAGELDIKMAIKDYLPRECWGVMSTFKLPTTTNNYIVSVPAMDSQELLQQKEIKVKGKNCKIMLYENVHESFL